jgi:regulatory factor X, other
LPYLFTDCGIRPSNPAEAEWLQEYVTKSNNNAGQQSINAARMASEAGDGQMDKLSDEDEDDDSENGAPSGGVGTASKRSSLALPGDVKGAYAPDMSDKTPTAATLLAQAQSAQRSAGSYPPQASIRRHPNADGGSLAMGGSGAPSTSTQPHAGATYMTSPQPVSVRQFPNFPTIDDAVGSGPSPQGIAAREVWGWFQDHLDSLLESARLFRFDQFEMHLRTFWGNLTGHHREVVHAPAIAGLMARADAIVYDVSSSIIQY